MIVYAMSDRTVHEPCIWLLLRLNMYKISVECKSEHVFILQRREIKRLKGQLCNKGIRYVRNALICRNCSPSVTMWKVEDYDVGGTECELLL